MLKSARILILLLLPGWGLCLFSQQLSHQVLVPVAGVVETGSVSYSQTIGETAVEIVTSPELVFTQGFQQPCMKLLTIIPPVGNGVDVYPNPAIDNLTIKLFGNISRDFRIDIINITGTIVISENISLLNSFFIEKTIPVGNLNKGIYFVRVASKDKAINRTFKIDKM